MSIKSWIKRRRMRRAYKRGKALSSAGVTSTTQRTTTGGYATSSGEVNVTRRGITVRRNSGGSSGGGGISNFSKENAGSVKEALLNANTSKEAREQSGKANNNYKKFQRQMASRQAQGQYNRRINSAYNSAQKLVKTNKLNVTQANNYLKDVSRGLKERLNREYSNKINKINQNYQSNIQESNINVSQKNVSKEQPSKIVKALSTIKSLNTSYLKKAVPTLSAKEILSTNKKNINEINNLKDSLKKLDLNYRNVIGYEIPKFKDTYGSDTSKYSESQINAYNELVNKQNKLAKEINSKKKLYDEKLRKTSKNIGFFNYNRKVPVTELSSPFGYVGETSKAIVGQYSKGLGSLYKNTVGKIKLKKQPEAVMDLNAGVFRVAGKEDIRTVGKNILQPSKVERGVSGVSNFGKYFVPYAGQALFVSDVGEQLSQENYNPISFVKKHPIETGLIVGGLALGGGLKIRNNIRVGRINEALDKEISAIENKRLSSLTFEDKGNGFVIGTGYAETENTIKEISYLGKIKKTESGKKFIPSGEGMKTISGVIDVKGEKYIFTGGQEFKFGSRGKNIHLGNLGNKFDIFGNPLLSNKGNIKAFEEVGTSTILTPKESYFGISRLETEGNIRAKALKDLGKQLRKPNKVSEETIKDISLPIGQRNLLLQINKNAGLRVNPQEVGVIITIPKNEIKVNKGFKGGGSKSSKQFFENLYKEKNIPQLSLMSNNLEIIPKVKIKSKFTGSVVSASVVNEFSKPSMGKTTIKQEVKRDVKNIKQIRENALIQPKIQLIKEEEKQRSMGRSGQVSISRTKEIQKPSIKIKNKVGEIFNQKSKQPIKPKPRTYIRTKMVEQQEIPQNMKILVRNIITQNLIEEKLSIPRIKIKNKVNKTKKYKKIIADELFKIYGKRYGKFKKIGTAKTKKGAIEEAKKFSLETLGASTLVEKGGRKIDVSLGEGFRKSKSNRFIQVQRRGKRLTSSGERKEIKRSRKKGGFFK